MTAVGVTALLKLIDDFAEQAKKKAADLRGRGLDSTAPLFDNAVRFWTGLGNAVIGTWPTTKSQEFVLNYLRKLVEDNPRAWRRPGQPAMGPAQ